MQKSKLIIAGHIIFWLAYLALIYSIFYSLFTVFASDQPNFAWKPTAIFLMLHIPMAYINIFVLIPQLYLKKKYILYSLGCAVLITVVVLLFQNILHDFFNSMMERNRLMFLPPGFTPGTSGMKMPVQFPHPNSFRLRGPMELSISLSVLLISSIYTIAREANRKEREAEQLKSENFNSELKFLKSQINPHFLFNTLNNIYALSLLKSDKTPDTVMRLSEMLRYVLYECNVAERVPVSKEVIYIKNYIALQLLRDSKIKNVNFTTVIERDVEVAPMLFIPFVENAFKHSKIENIEEGWINISLTAKSNQVQLVVENSKPRVTFQKDATGGIGIENVNKRLKLLYPENHFIQFDQNEKSYKISMELMV